MLKDHTIICFANGYDAPPTSKHHVMHDLADGNTVLWVNYHASRKPTASKADLLHSGRKLGQVFAGLKNPRPNIYVLTPLVVPLPKSAWAKKLNRMLLVSQIRRSLRGLAQFAESSEQNVPVPLAATEKGSTSNDQPATSHSPVQFWSFTPDVSYLLGKFGEQKVVYYCVDEHAEFTGHDREQVLRDEEDLCRRSDLVVTTAFAASESQAAVQ